MIKAIETQYKGYKFRSRLEARWAVFFDALGVCWEYEKEGYQLGDGTYYLPDFWLPTQSTFVEIKPENSDQRSRLIYLAGKMGYGKEDWRSSLSWGAKRTFSLEEYEEEIAKKSYPDRFINGHSFVGPYRVDEMSGHGSGHITVYTGHADDDDMARQTVFEGSKKMVRQADTVFAWIDSPDCFGTIAEIGYAHALGKEIWIGTPWDLSSTECQDFWFVFSMATKRAIASSPVDAFLIMDEPLLPYEKKCACLSEMAEVILIEGSPDEGHKFYSAAKFSKRYPTGAEVRAGNLVYAMGQIGVLRKGWDIDATRNEVFNAMRKAKQARFEHRETPRV